MEAEAVAGGSVRRRLWTTDEKRRIVEQTLASGVLVAMVARQHGVNANQVFYWRKLYQADQLVNSEKAQGARLLPVSVSDEEPSPVHDKRSRSMVSTVHIVVIAS